jgi:hypothetical protein
MNIARFFWLLALVPSLSAWAAKPINLVFILTDTQGAWTLGCYGNPDIRTPHIDQLAAEGMRFTRALSSNPVCSPTRATFLTGLIPSQHGVHSFLDPKFMMGPEAYNTLQEFTSLGEVLRNAGYTCGLSGKWHLGANMTPSEGFTTWTTKPDGSTKEFYDQEIIEDGKLRTEPGYTTDLWTRKGVEFIQQHKERPFFLFLAYNGPYNLGKLMSNPPKNRHAAYYREKPFNSSPAMPCTPGSGPTSSSTTLRPRWSAARPRPRAWTMAWARSWPRSKPTASTTTPSSFMPPTKAGWAAKTACGAWATTFAPPVRTI